MAGNRPTKERLDFIAAHVAIFEKNLTGTEPELPLYWQVAAELMPEIEALQAEKKATFQDLIRALIRVDLLRRSLRDIISSMPVPIDPFLLAWHKRAKETLEHDFEVYGDKS